MYLPVCLLQLKRLMGGRNWKHKKESVTLRDVNEEEIAQTGQHMRLVHSTEEMDALALASKVHTCIHTYIRVQNECNHGCLGVTEVL